MKFPGSNKLELNMSATRELIAEHLERSFSARGVRVTDVEISGSYSAKTLDVTFTTDPDPLAPPDTSGSAPMSHSSADDDHIF